MPTCDLCLDTGITGDGPPQMDGGRIVSVGLTHCNCATGTQRRMEGSLTDVLLKALRKGFGLCDFCDSGIKPDGDFCTECDRGRERAAIAKAASRPPRAMETQPRQRRTSS